MVYSKENFSEMPYNPFVTANMVDSYAYLRRVKSFTEVPVINTENSVKSVHLTSYDVDKMLRFCVLMIDPRGNPLAEEKDFQYRSDTVWELLGVPNRNSTTKILQKQNHWWYRHMLCEYLKLVYNDQYVSWFSLKMNFNATTQYLIGGNGADVLDYSVLDEKDMKARKAAAETQAALRQEIARLEATLFKAPEIKEAVVMETFFPDRLAEQFAIEYT